MTTPNIITRTCIALVIVLSILLAGGAPSDPSPQSIGIDGTQIQISNE